MFHNNRYSSITLALPRNRMGCKMVPRSDPPVHLLGEACAHAKRATEDTGWRAESVPHDWRRVVLPVAPAPAGPRVSTEEGSAGHRTSALPSSLSAFKPADGWRRKRLAAAKTRCPFPSCVSGFSPSPGTGGREKGARLCLTFYPAKVASGCLPR